MHTIRRIKGEKTMVDAQTIVNETDKISSRRSFKGYSLMQAIMNNSNEIKLFLAALALVGGAGFNWKLFLLTSGVGFIILCLKVGLDAVHFYFKEVEIKK